MSARYLYRRRAEGEIDDLDPRDLLDQLADDLLESGDVERALDRAVREGFTTAEGEHVVGLRELLEQVRAQRRALERQADPSGSLERYRARLDEIDQMEEAELDELARAASDSGDARRAEVTEGYVRDQRLARSLVGPSVPERVAGMRDYDFASSAAAEAFEQLLSEIRADAAGAYVAAARAALATPDPAALAHLRTMMDDLSSLLERRARGEDTAAEESAFLERYADLFAGATSLDDVVRQLAERAAAAEAVMRSMTAEQRAEMASLVEGALADVDLAWSLQRLTANLRRATPDLDWSRAIRLRGPAASWSDAVEAGARIGELADLESLLGGPRASEALGEVDVEAVARNLGPDLAADVERLARAERALRDQGLMERSGGRLRLTARGTRRIGERALRQLFDRVRASVELGQHVRPGPRGGEHEGLAEPWEPGRPLDLHLSATLRNALARAGPGVPVRLAVQDFAVEVDEGARTCATVVAIDLSLSMGMRGNLAPAKKMALALTTLIRTRYPRDYLALVGFGQRAAELRIDDVPALSIDGAYGTNLQHALALARRLLAHQGGERQIVVVTDGEPTAHLDDEGTPFFAWPPVRETLERTMAEVIRCTRAGIVINTFALDVERSQFPFVDQIARVNRGRTFFVDAPDLGRFVLDDYVRQHVVRRES